MTSNHRAISIELLDTNIFIRHLTQDHVDHSARAYRLFQEVERGDRIVTISEGVLVEAVQVLSSKALYAMPRAEIQERLSIILSLLGFSLTYKPTYLRALNLYATTTLDFVDCLNIAHAERAGYNAILSFDQGYDRVPGIVRREP